MWLCAGWNVLWNWSNQSIGLFKVSRMRTFSNRLHVIAIIWKPGRPGGGGGWPMFGYRGAAEGMKAWSCSGQKRHKILTPSGTTPSILRPYLGQTINDDNRTLETLFRTDSSKITVKHHYFTKETKSSSKCRGLERADTKRPKNRLKGNGFEFEISGCSK